MEDPDQIREEVQFGSNYSLLLKLQPPHFSRKYWCMQVFKSGEERTSIKYELEIKYIRTIAENLRVFEMIRSPEVYIDDIAPDLLFDKMAYQCGTVFYPLLVTVDFKGNFCAVYNHGEIMERWIAVKLSVASYFKGAEVDRYLNLMERSVSSLDTLNDVFSRDILVRSYFNSLYKSYGAELCVHEKRHWPLPGGTGAGAFDVNESVQPQLTDRGSIRIEHDGAGENSTYEASYVLEANTRAIETIIAKWTFTQEVKQSVKILLFRTDESPRDLPESDAKNHGRDLIYLDGQHGEKSSQGKLKRIINSFFGN